MTAIDRGPLWHQEWTRLPAADARELAQLLAGDAHRLQGYTRTASYQVDRADAREYAYSKWRAAVVLRLQAGDLAGQQQVDVALHLVETGWYGTLDELVATVKDLTDG